jgi:glycerol-3-phosphate acyltransferase PlsY
MSLSTGAAAAVTVLAAYVIGSIPFAVIAGRLWKGVDIRSEGSGNAGATNVYRVLGWKAALAVLTADFAKGFLPVFFSTGLFAVMSADSAAGRFSPTVLKILVLIAVVLGHAFPLWAGFRGGKGVACSAGGVTALFPVAAPVCLAVFVLTLLITSYVSAASLITAWSLPLVFVILRRLNRGGEDPVLMTVFFVLVALIITVLHRKNIIRLIRGEEPEFRFRS